MANAILDQINRQGDIIKYVQAMKYNVEQNRFAQQRQAAIDRQNEQMNALTMKSVEQELEAGKENALLSKHVQNVYQVYGDDLLGASKYFAKEGNRDEAQGAYDLYQDMNPQPSASDITSRLLYNIENPNLTKIVPIQKGVEVTPPEGWTFKTPSTVTSGQWDTLDPTQKQVLIEQYVVTGKKPEFYYRDQDSKMAFNSDVGDYLTSKGMTASDMASTQAEYKSLDLALKQQQKTTASMRPFVENLNLQIDRVDELYEKLIDRVGVRGLDVPIRELKTRLVGSGEEQALRAYLLEISNEIGKLSTGSQASIRELSTEAQARWDKIHDPNLSLPEMKTILDETKLMAEYRMSTATKSVDYLKNSISGLLGGEEPNDIEGGLAAGTVEVGYRFKGGDPADENNWEKVE